MYSLLWGGLLSDGDPCVPTNQPKLFKVNEKIGPATSADKFTGFHGIPALFGKTDIFGA